VEVTVSEVQATGREAWSKKKRKARSSAFRKCKASTLRLVLRRSAFARRAPVKSAWPRSAPNKSASSRLAFCKLAFRKSACRIFVDIKSAFSSRDPTKLPFRTSAHARLERVLMNGKQVGYLLIAGLHCASKKRK
jgi:hypothetical protein